MGTGLSLGKKLSILQRQKGGDRGEVQRGGAEGRGMGRGSE